MHEHIIVKGRTEHLVSEMDHYAFPSIEVFVEKHNLYSNWEARVAIDWYVQNAASGLQKEEVSLRRRLKRFSHHMPLRPMLRFLYVYLWQCGFLDGIEGYYFARLHGYYEFLCVLKTREYRRGVADREQNVTASPVGVRSN